MAVHLFGARSSFACDTYKLRNLADHYKTASPTQFWPHHFIHRNFYVDDGLTSVPTEEEANDRIEQTQSLCAQGQLWFHKKASNSHDVIAKLPRSECSSVIARFGLTPEPILQERSLSVLWDTDQDFFTFNHEPLTNPDTRRGVLSSVASVFDPLGLISLFILKGRINLQKNLQEQRTVGQSTAITTNQSIV